MNIDKNSSLLKHKGYFRLYKMTGSQNTGAVKTSLHQNNHRIVVKQYT